ncbi:helix-turn-helix domain-containing protein [Streptomyces sp. NPDC051207]|uniref:helix-turn-helix domain-containing protein n=1 Tax=Streptomyces sp. NPDC051207 TaxID=3154641 RepID=UPI003446F877
MTRSSAIPLPSARERRRLREAASLTRTQLAARLGVPRETVRAWETGRTKPRGRKREAYAELLRGLAAAEAEARVQATSRQEPEAEAVPADPPPGLAPAATAAADTVTAAAPAAVRAEEPPPVAAEADPEPDPGPDAPPPLTPAQAFDALYAFCAPPLVRQAYLLTGRRELARESVERAFQVAWERWPEVARDRDPAGWVRATAYEYALSPWHRYRPRHRHPEPPPADPAARVLLDILLTLPPPYRRTLLLYDGVGLGLPETAAETEATTLAAANRLLYAREAVAARLPELSDPDLLHQRLAELASAERLRAAKPPRVRWSSERRAQFWTRAAIAFTVALIGTTALTLRTAPTRYEPPVPPGATVRGVPPRVAPGPLSQAELELRGRLRAQLTNGPERLTPLPG